MRVLQLYLEFGKTTDILRPMHTSRFWQHLRLLDIFAFVTLFSAFAIILLNSSEFPGIENARLQYFSGMSSVPVTIGVWAADFLWMAILPLLCAAAVTRGLWYQGKNGHLSVQWIFGPFVAAMLPFHIGTVYDLLRGIFTDSPIPGISAFDGSPFDFARVLLYASSLLSIILLPIVLLRWKKFSR
jgi:hypothetical protein